jgi:single-stranded-DNA-specific exonuclease
MEKRWVHEQVDKTKLENLVGTFKEKGNQIPESLVEILVKRGIDSYEKVLEYINPNKKNIHDPFLMKGMREAIDRIERAIELNESILVYGDYDVDGTTAVSLTYSFLKKFHSELFFYIPDRYKEGYGISFAGVDFAKEKNCKLIIALDCGIKSGDKVEYAKDFGIDFVICDHHIPGAQIPDAVAVLDPKQNDCNYPFKELSGCGIAYKLMQGLCISQEKDPELVNEFVDLVAVSIASDIVSMTGENRILMKMGLHKINSGKATKGIQGLIETSNKKGNLGIIDLLFIVGPRINAAGRISNANKVVELLTSGNAEIIEELSRQIDEHNIVRKKTDEQMTKEALELVDLDPQRFIKKSTIVFKSDWHKGVVGIVASRLIEKHYKPTIVLTEAEGKAVGSARSVLNFDVYEALCDCEEYLENYGGHRAAAGMTIDLKNLEAFKIKFEEAVQRRISEDCLTEPILIDVDLTLSDLNLKFLEILNHFEPFGPDNERPTFRTENASISGDIKVLKEKHLKFQIKDKNISIDCLFWSGIDRLEELKSAQKIDICYRPELNEWNGRKGLQLIIKDYKIKH